MWVDIISTVGDVQNRGGISSVLWSMFSIVEGDINSIVEDVQHCGGASSLLWSMRSILFQIYKKYCIIELITSIKVDIKNRVAK